MSDYPYNEWQQRARAIAAQQDEDSNRMYLHGTTSEEIKHLNNRRGELGRTRLPEDYFPKRKDR